MVFFLVYSVSHCLPFGADIFGFGGSYFSGAPFCTGYLLSPYQGTRCYVSCILVVPRQDLSRRHYIKAQSLLAAGWEKKT